MAFNESLHTYFDMSHLYLLVFFESLGGETQCLLKLSCKVQESVSFSKSLCYFSTLSVNHSCMFFPIKNKHWAGCIFFLDGIIEKLSRIWTSSNIWHGTIHHVAECTVNQLLYVAKLACCLLCVPENDVQIVNVRQLIKQNSHGILTHRTFQVLSLLLSSQALPVSVP